MSNGLLGGIEGAFSQAGNALSGVASTVTKDAGAFVAGAQNSVAQLTGSGVNAQGKIVGPLAEHFGSDPVQFSLHMVKFFDAFMRDVATRVADRTGNANFVVDTIKGKATVSARPKKGDTSAHITLILALDAIHHPAELVEEGSRAAQGLPTKRGLDGPNGAAYVWFPTAGIGGRGFFGIDEAAAAAAGLAILVAIAPGIITALISVVGAIAPEVVSGITSALGGNKPPPDPNAGKILGLDPPVALGVGAALLVLLGLMGYAIAKHGHHAAPAGGAA